MKNVQITIDAKTLAELDGVAGPLGLKRSEVVRQAVREWLDRHRVRQFEDEWVAALRRRPDDDASEWLPAQSWSKR